MARPLTGYIGGKWNLRRVICPLIDVHDHICYVEPFIGMGNIFLGRTRRPRAEVINDANGEVANLFRIVQRHPDALAAELRFAVTSRTDYARLRRIDPATLTDVERAARFLLLRRQTFSAKDDYAQGFAISTKTAKVIDTAELVRRIEALHERLDRVTIEGLDFRDCIRRYDSDGTFFYLDPPYYGCTHLYRFGGFRQGDFAELARLLEQTRARWLLSLNDVPAVRALFAFATVKTVMTRYNAAVGRGTTRRGELLISNGAISIPATARP